MLAILIVSFLSLYALYVVYGHLSSPLRNVPTAHPTSPFSGIWILSRTLVGRRNHSIHAAHLKHGPIVRLGPSEISINDPALVKAVYSAGNGFDKPVWYHIFTNYGFGPHPFFSQPLTHICVDLSPYLHCSIASHTPRGKGCCPTSIRIHPFQIRPLSPQQPARV